MENSSSANYFRTCLWLALLNILSREACDQTDLSYEQCHREPADKKHGRRVAGFYLL